MEKTKKTNVNENPHEEKPGLFALRDTRRKEFVAYMKKYPETLGQGERYRDGRRKFFGDLLFALMGMGDREDGFGEFTERILTTDDEALQYNFYDLDEALEKVKDPELAKDIRLTAYGILGGCEAFYLALGAYIGQHYQILDPGAQQEIDDIGKLMAEEAVFPLIPKQLPAVGPVDVAAAGVIPVRIEGAEKTVQEAKKPVAAKGMLTVEALAEKMGTSKTWIYKKVKAGILPHLKIGGVVRFIEKDLENWINGCKVKGALKV